MSIDLCERTLIRLYLHWTKATDKILVNKCDQVEMEMVNLPEQYFYLLYFDLGIAFGQQQYQHH